jgi:hypothetical protein
MFENFLTVAVVCDEEVFGPKGDAVKGDWRKWHNQELHYTLPSAYVIGVKKREK